MALHKTRIASLIGVALLAFGGTCATANASGDARPWMNPKLTPDQRAELVLKAMTQDEKFRLIRVDSADTENGHVMAPGALGSAGYGPAIARLARSVCSRWMKDLSIFR